MKNMMFVLLAVLLMTVSVAGNAMAAFEYGHLIRVVYDTVGSKEYATDLGSWATLSAAATDTTVGGGVDAINLATMGADAWDNLVVGYYMVAFVPNTGPNAVAVAADGVQTITSGSRKFSGIQTSARNTSGYYVANAIVGTKSAVIDDKAATGTNSFYNQFDAHGVSTGYYAGWETGTTGINPGGILSLADLTTTGYVEQTMVYFGPFTTITPNASTGVNSIKVRTMANGSTVILAAFSGDTVPPLLTVSAPADGLLTNIASVSVTGTATDAGGIKSVTVNGLPASVGAGGAFSATVTLVAGLNTITVVATDTANNPTTVIRSVTLDQVAPVVTVAVPEAGLATNTGTFTFTGNVSDVTATVTVNGLTVTVGAGGAFSTNVTLVAGTNTITTVATDNAGNPTTIIRSVTVDTVAPVLTVTAPVVGLVTGNATLAVTGTATDPGSGINTLTVNGLSVPVVAGAFSTNVTLVAGSNTITVVATDNAGNPATVTRSVTLAVAPVLTVNIQGTGAGSVNSSPAGIHCLSGSCQATFNPPGLVTLTADPNGDSVVSWSDACAACTGKSCNVTVTGGVLCGVTFSFVKPARIGTTDYDTLQAAYDAAAEGATIMVREYSFLSNLNMNLPKKVIIKGGYNQTYTVQSGFSSIKGVMTISKGSVIMEQLQVK
jgi:hypothetical protein